MPTSTDDVDMDAMSNRETRGLAIKEAVEQRRPEGLTYARLARDAGMSEQTVFAAIRGKTAEATYEAFEAAIREWDENPDDRPERLSALPSTSEGMIEVELDGVFGVARVFIRGPAGDPEHLAESVGLIFEQMRRGQSSA